MIRMIDVRKILLNIIENKNCFQLVNEFFIDEYRITGKNDLITRLGQLKLPFTSNKLQSGYCGLTLTFILTHPIILE